MPVTKYNPKEILEDPKKESELFENVFEICEEFAYKAVRIASSDKDGNPFPDDWGNCLPSLTQEQHEYKFKVPFLPEIQDVRTQRQKPK